MQFVNILVLEGQTMMLIKSDLARCFKKLKFISKWNHEMIFKFYFSEERHCLKYYNYKLL